MYLIPADYKKTIQAENLLQVIGSDETVLHAAEATAVEEATGFLVQKYQLNDEFADTTEWSDNVIYKVGQRVCFHPLAYNSGTTYVIDDLVNYNGKTYKSIAGNAPGAFNPAQWNDLNIPDNTLFYAGPPFPYFDVYAPYNIGDKVYYNGKIYTALQQSSFPSNPPSIEYGYYENVPAPNPFPGYGNFWSTGTVYTVPAATPITDTAFWTRGDNRSQLLLTYVVNMTLYYVHMRISPRNIPDLRVKAYDDAVKGLKRFAEGATTAAIPVKQPRQGGRVRYGGPIKNTNSYDPAYSKI